MEGSVSQSMAAVQKPEVRASTRAAVRAFARLSRKVSLAIAGLMAVFMCGTMLPMVWVMWRVVGHEAEPTSAFFAGFVLFVAGVLFFGAYHGFMEKSRLVEKALPALDGLAGLVEVGTHGYDFVCKVLSPNPAVPPLVLRVPFFFERVGIRLEVPWELPADVMVLKGTVYSDLPGLVEGLQDARRGLSGGEHLWTNLAKRRLEYLVVLRRGFRPKPDEGAESMRDRILDRWRHIESIRSKAVTEERFAPEFTLEDPREGWRWFWPATWCPRCRKPRLVLTSEGPEYCWRCRTRLIRLLCQSEMWPSRSALRRKMERVHERYRL